LQRADGRYFRRATVGLTAESLLRGEWETRGEYLPHIAQFLTFFGAADQRLGLLAGSGPYDPVNDTPTNPMQVLFARPELEERISDTAYEAFGTHATLRVQVLESQEQAAKVIYTTHSAGCLPQDLGRGIRIIVPILETDDSKVINWFWTEELEGTGFSPILIGMGASALAFASTRRAVIAEGASDAILLPTLLREAAEIDRLDYQVAPGLANVDAAAVRELDLVAARVAYLWMATQLVMPKRSCSSMPVSRRAHSQDRLAAFGDRS
jgi:hypothetical protein